MNMWLLDRIREGFTRNSRLDIQYAESLRKRADLFAIPDGRYQELLNRYEKGISLWKVLQEWGSRYSFAYWLEAYIFYGTKRLGTKFEVLTLKRETEISEFIRWMSEFWEDIRMSFWHFMKDREEARRFQRLCFLWHYWQTQKGTLWKSPYINGKLKLHELLAQELAYMNFASSKPKLWSKLHMEESDLLERQKQVHIQGLPNSVGLLWIKFIQPHDGVTLLEEYFVVKNPSFSEIRAQGANMLAIWPLFFKKHAQLLSSDDPIVDELRKLLWEAYFWVLLDGVETSKLDWIVHQVETRVADIQWSGGWKTSEWQSKIEPERPLIQSGIPSDYRFKKPSMRSPFIRSLSNSRTGEVTVKREDIVQTIPHKKYTLLWLYVPDETGSKEWIWKSVADASSITIFCVPGFRYQCTFSRPENTEYEWIEAGIITDFFYEIRTSVPSQKSNNPAGNTKIERDTSDDGGSTIQIIKGTSISVRDVFLKLDIIQSIHDEVTQGNSTPYYDAWKNMYTLMIAYWDDYIYLEYNLITQEAQVRYWDLQFEDESTVIKSEIDAYFEKVVLRVTQEKNEEKNRKLWELGKYTTGIVWALREHTPVLPSFRYNDKLFTGIWVMMWKGNHHVEKMLDSISQKGLEIVAERSWEWWSELRIQLRFEEEAETLWTITSTPQEPYYAIALQKSHPQVQFIGSILQDMYFIFGYIWARAGWVIVETWRKTWNKRYILDEELPSILEYWFIDQQSRPDQLVKTKILTWYELGFVRDNIYRWILWEWKSRMKDGSIEWKKHQYLLKTDNNIESIVLLDERIQYAGYWETPEVYEKIRRNKRLQKYFILRMVATIIGRSFRNKSPFPGRMQAEFKSFWSGIDRVIQEKFLACMQEWVWWSGEALALKCRDGISLFEKMLNYFESHDIALLYVNPVLIDVDSFVKEAQKLGYMKD